MRLPLPTIRKALAPLLAAALLAGCRNGPKLVPAEGRVPLDRAVVEYPPGLALTPFAQNLTAPTAMAFDRSSTGPHAGALLVVINGVGDKGQPTILGFDRDGKRFQVFPIPSARIKLIPLGFRLRGPVGGMLVHDGEIFVGHRDADGNGVITAFKYDGTHRTVVGGLPAQGDYGVTDLVIHPTNGRLYFGLGAATNSGVVGLDNWKRGWVRRHPAFHDKPFAALKLYGYRFSTPNPTGGLLGGADVAVTAPFNAFNESDQRIPPAPDEKPGGAVYSASPAGGDLRVEAHGLRLPRGLAFNDFGNLFVANDGMELRGTRPVKDDPDALLRVPLGGPTWYGWPDYSADLVPVWEKRFQPPPEMVRPFGYPETSFLIDHGASGLIPPDRNTLLRATFPALSGAGKMDFAPDEPGFGPYRGQLLVALSGDRAPFATSGMPLLGTVGRKVVRVDLDARTAEDFVANTARKPGHELGERWALERPIDVATGPDGAVYILDAGRVDYPDGRSHVAERSGKVYRLAPVPKPSTAPASQTAPPS